MKELGLPLGFKNQTPYDVDSEGVTFIKPGSKPRHKKRGGKKKKVRDY